MPPLYIAIHTEAFLTAQPGKEPTDAKTKSTLRTCRKNFPQVVKAPVGLVCKT